MGEYTKIQWTDSTANLWFGCHEINSGCDNCYARVFASRMGKADAWEGVRYECPGIWKKLDRWQRDAAKTGHVAKVFVGSMMDIAEKNHAVTAWNGRRTLLVLDDLRRRFFEQVVPQSPDLLFQLLTKRPGNVCKVVPKSWLLPGGWPPNVIIGTSVVDQETADTLIPQLLKVPGKRFLSMEPLLGPVDLGRWMSGLDVSRDEFGNDLGSASGGSDLDWVIVGGESGDGARPFHVRHGIDLMGQCADAGVPFFWKQMGSHPIDMHGERIILRDSHGGDWSEWPQDLRVRECPEDVRIPEAVS